MNKFILIEDKCTTGCISINPENIKCLASNGAKRTVVRFIDRTSEIVEMPITELTALLNAANSKDLKDWRD